MCTFQEFQVLINKFERRSHTTRLLGISAHALAIDSISE
jgi:hypothetical protein